MNFLILGMPNVGKTSLYNIITDNDYNIIHKTVGTTRDWHFSPIKENKNFYVYDTPGVISKKKDFLDKNINKLIKEINIILYVIDYKSNNFFKDIEIINFIRKYNKEIILIINKDDNLNQNKNLQSLGINNFFYISCSHKKGISNLITFLNKYEVRPRDKEVFNFSIGLFGKTNVGKSTLLNKLVGYDRSVVSNVPKTTTDIVNSSFKFDQYNYLIKDTAGLIKKNKIDKNSLDFYTTKKTLSIIKDIDLNIFLIDIEQAFDNQSKKIFNLVYQKSNVLLFIINKIDLIKKNKRKRIYELKEEIEKEFSQSKNISILAISSFNHKDIIKLKKIIHKLIYNVNKHIPTAKLNKWLNTIAQKNPHPRVKGKEVKFKYATQVLHNPLTIKIFSNFSREIRDQYKKFLLNNFYTYFKIKSKNIKFIFTNTINPYK